MVDVRGKRQYPQKLSHSDDVNLPPLAFGPEYLNVSRAFRRMNLTRMPTSSDDVSRLLPPSHDFFASGMNGRIRLMQRTGRDPPPAVGRSSLGMPHFGPFSRGAPLDGTAPALLRRDDQKTVSKSCLGPFANLFATHLVRLVSL